MHTSDLVAPADTKRFEAMDHYERIDLLMYIAITDYDERRDVTPGLAELVVAWAREQKPRNRPGQTRKPLSL